MGSVAARVTTPIPPLRDGDRMDSREFFRRYEADTSVVRAELLDGVVFINARRAVVDGVEQIMPPIAGGHSAPQADLLAAFGLYAAFTPGTKASGPTTIRMSDRTNPEPDALLAIRPECGGRARLAADDYYNGPPELIAEVANTSAGRDLGQRFQAYQVDGVKEYLVCQTARGVIEWFVRRRAKYVPLAADADGVTRSVTFPGLWLDVPALLNGQMARVLQVVQAGIAAPEHVAFVSKLAAAAARRMPKP